MTRARLTDPSDACPVAGAIFSGGHPNETLDAASEKRKVSDKDAMPIFRTTRAADTQSRQGDHLATPGGIWPPCGNRKRDLPRGIRQFVLKRQKAGGQTS